MPDVNVNCVLEVKTSGLIDLSFVDVDPDDLPDLLNSIGTREFQEQMVAKFEEAVAQKRAEREATDGDPA